LNAQEQEEAVEEPVEKQLPARGAAELGDKEDELPVTGGRPVLGQAQQNEELVS
jgi:hypothetical protein